MKLKKAYQSTTFVRQLFESGLPAGSTADNPVDNNQSTPGRENTVCACVTSTGIAGGVSGICHFAGRQADGNSHVYSSATARNAGRFLQAVIAELPFPLLSIQVDGGSEFMADFERPARARVGACGSQGVWG